MVRAFTAISIEDEEIIQELKQVQDEIDLGFSTVEPEKMHITLQFFEEISEDELEKIKKAMDELELESFRLRIEGMGAFPSTEFIRVIWAGAENRQIRNLHQQLTSLGIQDDNSHDFKPHVTLARVEKIGKEKKRKLRRILEEYSNHLFGDIEVRELKLYESRLKPEGAEYREIYSVEI